MTLDTCKSCGGYDGAPKHHVYDPSGDVFTTKHITCCAAEGCAVCLNPE